MKILTSKNGIALVAVLTVLLVLTLLLPAMFTMTEAATKSSVKAQTEQQASYLARSTVEMAVLAFEECYDKYKADKDNYEQQKANATNPESVVKSEFCIAYEKFAKPDGSMKANRVYMYTKPFLNADGVEYIPDKDDPAQQDAWELYEDSAVVYNITGETPSDYTLFGYADCDITYEVVAEYYRIHTNDGSMELLVPQDDGNGNIKTPEQQYNQILGDYKPGSGGDTCHKVERTQVRFTAVATVDGKKYNAFSRSCLVILPTNPVENNWLAPTKIAGNQIFADTTKATGMSELSYTKDFTGINGGGGSDGAIDQILYSFSSSGNMVISTKGLDGKQFDLDRLSLGVEPVTKTKNPENDPDFNCLATNNMKEWAGEVQKDNFIMFSSPTGIQVDMPVNLLINPCRTMRIGDGISPNQTLYKLLVFQAPEILFKGKVNSMVSLWKMGGIESVFDALLGDGYDARRVTSIILAAPENTQHSYVNEGRGNSVVKAGKVCFMEDAYIWLIPVTERGSSYKTQTVYYKNSDIEMHKIANAGDVYYFNAEVATQDGKNSTGFSMSAYFMDVKYPEIIGDKKYGWDLWKAIREQGFGFAQKTFIPVTYVEEDFKWIGNIYTGENLSELEISSADDIVVVWES